MSESKRKTRTALTAPWELADAAALQALQRGDADSHAQQRALKWIIESGCSTYDLSFRPGEEGRRETDFAEGRRFVGTHIVMMLKANLSLLRRNNA